MSFKVSVKARDDLRHIGRYTQKTWGTAQRRNYLADLNAAFALLGDSPGLAVLRTEFTPPVRLHPHGRHVILYTDHPDGVLIVRGLHQSQGIEAILAGE